MTDIAQRGNRLTNKHISKDLVRNVYEHVAPKHSPGQKKKPHSSKEGREASFGRIVRDVGKILSPKRDKKFGGGRTNLLEQLGRVEAEPSNPNRRAEISRVHGELNRGYKTGGRVGKAIGGAATIGKTVKKFAKQYHKKKKLAEDTKKGKFPETESLTHQKGPYVGDVGSEKRVKKAKGGKTDKKWIQKAVNPKHKGYCTPMTKKTCTPARKALARTFKKKAKTGW